MERKKVERKTKQIYFKVTDIDYALYEKIKKEKNLTHDELLKLLLKNYSEEVEYEIESSHVKDYTEQIKEMKKDILSMKKMMYLEYPKSRDNQSMKEENNEV